MNFENNPFKWEPRDGTKSNSVFLWSALNWRHMTTELTTSIGSEECVCFFGDFLPSWWIRCDKILYYRSVIKGTSHDSRSNFSLLSRPAVTECLWKLTAATRRILHKHVLIFVQSTDDIRALYMRASERFRLYLDCHRTNSPEYSHMLCDSHFLRTR